MRNSLTASHGDPFGGTLRELYTRCLQAIDLSLQLPRRLPIDAAGILLGHDPVAFSEFDEAIVIAIGKAAVPLAIYVAPRLALPARGVVVAPDVTGVPIGWARFQGGHPTPDLESFRAAEAVVRELERVHERSLVLFLLSGGGSAMMEQPLDPTITVGECCAFHEALVGCGAPIEVINALRKHTSAVKGGRLAQAAVPARQVTCFVSDVPPDAPSAVASGPTFPDETTVEMCRAFIESSALLDRVPASYHSLLGALAETPKAGDACFARSSFHALLDNRDATDFLVRETTALGWRVASLDVPESATIDDAVTTHLVELDRLHAHYPGETVALVSGGEVNCPTGHDPGIGGRNLALSVALAIRLEGRTAAFLCAGTDGIDGNSPAAGAVVDGATVQRAKEAGIDLAVAFDRRDAYPALDRLGCTLVTGPTGNNVRDVRVLVSRRDP